MSKNMIDMTGQTFNGIRVIRRAEKHNRAGEACWECVCPYCGKLFETAGGNLRFGRVKSCGCLRRAPRGRRTDVKAPRTVAALMPTKNENKPDMIARYGCTLCAAAKNCTGACRYAPILDKYGDYAEYDRQAERLLRW